MVSTVFTMYEPVHCQQRSPGSLEERVVASAEAREMLVGEQVALMHERLEDQRMHNVEAGYMLCTTLNAIVAAQQEHNGIVREGVATHARLFRTTLTTEKQKQPKLLRRTGAICSSMVATGQSRRALSKVTETGAFEPLGRQPYAGSLVGTSERIAQRIRCQRSRIERLLGASLPNVTCTR